LRPNPGGSAGDGGPRGRGSGRWPRCRPVHHHPGVRASLPHRTAPLDRTGSGPPRTPRPACRRRPPSGPRSRRGLPMNALLLALVAGLGVHLIWSATVLGEHGLRSGRGSRGPFEPARAVERWLTQAGLEEVRAVEFIAVTITLAMFGAA